MCLKREKVSYATDRQCYESGYVTYIPVDFGVDQSQCLTEVSATAP